MVGMCRKYLDRDLIKAIRITSGAIRGMRNYEPYTNNYDEMASLDQFYWNFGITKFWSCIARSHFTTSIEKVQQRLRLLDEIKHRPMRRKLMYLTIVLGCDTPIIEAIHHHSGLSIPIDKN
jgi:hypothetical protein